MKLTIKQFEEDLRYIAFHPRNSTAREVFEKWKDRIIEDDED